MFKYSPINSYSLRNLQNSQIYFNSPLNFNDPFDTFHFAAIKEISNSKFAEFYCKSSKRKFDKNHLVEILESRITRQELYLFSELHIDYIFDLSESNADYIFKSKEIFLNHLISANEWKVDILEKIIKVFLSVKTKLQTTICNKLSDIRQESFSKVGVCCFSKNNDNLLMWSHYADSHQGICLEFDSKFEPFSKAFEVDYQSQIPDINVDLLFEEEDKAELIKNFLSFKSTDWMQEQELRLLHLESNVSYFYPTQSLKGIYFGLKTNPSDIEIICSIVKSKTSNVKFYRMIKIAGKFGIEAEQFDYTTVIDVQSSLRLTISDLFGYEEFTLEELFSKTHINITKIQLTAHIKDMKNKSILIEQNERYQLSR